jgi:hypothetical protein
MSSKIQDTGKGTKSVAENLEAVLRKIEGWHQGSIAGYRMSVRDVQGLEHRIEWNGREARVCLIFATAVHCKALSDWRWVQFTTALTLSPSLYPPRS